MTELERLEAFRKELNSDKGLQSKRKILTYISLIILSIELSGATIKEANTFIFKIDFVRPEGLNMLLALLLLFCLIRYFNYSCQYSERLSSFWKSSFLSDDRILFFDDHAETYYGLLSPIANENFSSFYGMLRNGEVNDFKKHYISHFIPFKKKYIKSWVDNHGESHKEAFSIRKNIGFLNLLKVIRIEWSYRTEAFFKSPDSLDLSAPYILSALAFTFMINSSRFTSFLMSLV